MNEIAARAQVGKQTLYRWWKNRAELLMEALQYNAGCADSSGKPVSNDVSLRIFIANTFSAVNKSYGAILKSLVAESMADREFFRVFLKEFILKRQEALMYVVRREFPGKESDDEYVNTVVDMIFGAMWYRLLFEHRPLDDNFAESLTSVITGRMKGSTVRRKPVK